MLAMTRETILDHLDSMGKLVNQYARREVFIEQVLGWLERVEQTLQRLRSPLASLIANERGLILAVADGYRDPAIQADRTSARKAERATTSLALGRIGDALRARVAEVDGQLEALREKMASFLAAASVQVPIPLPPTEPRDQWLTTVWRTLGTHQGTEALYAYLNASLSRHDRLYLLDQILHDLLGEQVSPDPTPAEAPTA